MKQALKNGAAPANVASTGEKSAALAAWLAEHKAENIESMELEQTAAFADAMITASAGSTRHAQSLARGLAEFCGESGYGFSHIEGLEAGQWILLDLHDIIVNIFLEPVRELYRIEDLWGRHIPDAPRSPSTELDG